MNVPQHCGARGTHDKQAGAGGGRGGRFGETIGGRVSAVPNNSDCVLDGEVNPGSCENFNPKNFVVLFRGQCQILSDFQTFWDF